MGYVTFFLYVNGLLPGTIILYGRQVMRDSFNTPICGKILCTTCNK